VVKGFGGITEIAESHARAYTEVMREFGRPINAETISGYIEAACLQMEENWGKSNCEYLATEWLR
jgi:hypothetical protein